MKAVASFAPFPFPGHMPVMPETLLQQRGRLSFFLVKGQEQGWRPRGSIWIEELRLEPVRQGVGCEKNGTKLCARVLYIKIGIFHPSTSSATSIGADAIKR